MKEFTLPNLGDGVAAGDVLRVMVKVGDMLAVDQPVLELETDKATLEVPSTVAGRVKEVRVKQGDKVKPGQAVLVVDEAGAGAAPRRAAAPRAAKAEAAATRRGRPGGGKPARPGRRRQPDRAQLKAGPGEGDAPTDRGKTARRAEAEDAGRAQRQGAGVRGQPSGRDGRRPRPAGACGAVGAPAGARARRRSLSRCQALVRAGASARTT